MAIFDRFEGSSRGRNQERGIGAVERPSKVPGERLGRIISVNIGRTLSLLMARSLINYQNIYTIKEIESGYRSTGPIIKLSSRAQVHLM